MSYPRKPQPQGWAYLVLTVLLLVLLVGTLIPGSLKREIEGHFWRGVPWSSLANFGLFGAITALPVYGRGWGARFRVFILLTHNLNS